MPPPAAATSRFTYDVGRGFSEADSAKCRILPGTKLAPLRLPLPFGVVRQFRFDPIDNDSTVVFAHARMAEPMGSGHPDHRAGSLPSERSDQELLKFATPSPRSVPPPGADDPNLALTLDHPLLLRGDWVQFLKGDWLKESSSQPSASGGRPRGSPVDLARPGRRPCRRPPPSPGGDPGGRRRRRSRRQLSGRVFRQEFRFAEHRLLASLSGHADHSRGRRQSRRECPRRGCRRP